MTPIDAAWTTHKATISDWDMLRPNEQRGRECGYRAGWQDAIEAASEAAMRLRSVEKRVIVLGVLGLANGDDAE